MAVLKNSSSQVTIPAGERVQGGATELGVTFGCRKGVCGACVVEVLAGMENLSEKSGVEKEFGMRDNDRMMCQCSILDGTVTIKG